MTENVFRYGMGEKLASFRSVDLGVLEFHQDEEETARRFIEVGREAVERDGAEVLVLGCTATYGFYRELQEELGVPVIDSMIAAFKTAEYAADLKSRFGWSHSKIGGYESPPPGEFGPWQLEQQYDHRDMGAWLQRAKKAAQSKED
jgi:allantoin racemase